MNDAPRAWGRTLRLLLPTAAVPPALLAHGARGPAPGDAEGKEPASGVEEPASEVDGLPREWDEALVRRALDVAWGVLQTRLREGGEGGWITAASFVQVYFRARDPAPRPQPGSGGAPGERRQASHTRGGRQAALHPQLWALRGAHAPGSALRETWARLWAAGEVAAGPEPPAGPRRARGPRPGAGGAGVVLESEAARAGERARGQGGGGACGAAVARSARDARALRRGARRMLRARPGRGVARAPAGGS